MINLIVQVDSHETLETLQLFAELYCKGKKITSPKERFVKDIELTSRKAITVIDIQELSADTLLGKIDQDELENMWAEMKVFFC